MFTVVVYMEKLIFGKICVSLRCIIKHQSSETKIQAKDTTTSVTQGSYP